MTTERKTNLKIFANNVRRGIIEGVYSARSGHPGGSLSIADTLTYLYNEVLNIDVKNPRWEKRDRFVLSKGHCAPALYAVLANMGYFDVSELKKLRKTGAMLQGHPDMKGTPGVDMTTGSLGQGISAACGMALSAKISNEDYKVYAVLGDGELQEGQVWEACMFAAHNKLSNLVVIVDNNGLQIDGNIADVCSPYPITDKFEAFGFKVMTMNAHCFDDIEKVFNECKENNTDKPIAIIQKSVKGKNISFMENNAAWHGTAPNDEQYNIAMEDLNKIEKELLSK